MKFINLTIMQKCKILFFFFREAEAPFSYQPKLNCDLRHIVEIPQTLNSPSSVINLRELVFTPLLSIQKLVLLFQVQHGHQTH